MTLQNSPKFRRFKDGAHYLTLFRGNAFWIAGVYPRIYSVNRPIEWSAFRTEAEAVDWLSAHQTRYATRPSATDQ